MYVSYPHLHCAAVVILSYVWQFYSKDFDEDAVRVNKWFAAARSIGFTAQKEVLSLDKLKKHLDQGGVAIVLLNVAVVHYNCAAQILPWICCCCMSICSIPTFWGHYVVVCGYDNSTDTFEYVDPARARTTSRISFSRFEKARHDKGTDDDVILISK